MDVSVKEAEAVRKTLGLTIYEFSVRLGYSPTAYHYALRRKKISRYMSREIAVRWPRTLKARRG